jgi:two-component system LytT family response regulator
MTDPAGLSVLIVDDEALARRSVARQVAAVLPGAEVREAADGFDALERIREKAPDIVFLDVEMPELSGLDVLRQLGEPRPRVVFVTAFEHFAVRAFDENASDYLVKPFTPARFAAAVERVLGELDSAQKLASLERRLAESGRGLERLALRRGPGFDVVAVSDVASFVSQDHYTFVYANGHEYISELSLGHFEERLDAALFTRAHRSVLVSVRHVSRVLDDTIVLKNGQEVALSRRSRGPLLKLLRAAGYDSAELGDGS